MGNCDLRRNVTDTKEDDENDKKNVIAEEMHAKIDPRYVIKRTESCADRVKEPFLRLYSNSPAHLRKVRSKSALPDVLHDISTGQQ